MLVHEQCIRMSSESNKRHSKKLGIKKALQSVAFYSAYCVFGGVGFVSSVVCLVLSTFYHGQAAHYFGQKIIHHLFAFFVGYVRFFKLVEVDGTELAKIKDCRGVIFVANHPSLLDVVFVIAHMPRMVCLMKPSLLRNIILSGQARLAGYVASNSGSGLIKSCLETLRQGGNLLIFPEGTRSKQMQPGPFKMGFAMIATENHSPVQTLIITLSDNYLGKGYSFLKQPALPIRCSIRLGDRFEPELNDDARSFGRKIESYYQNILTKTDSDSCRI
jgi:1-acyl-sn-glycerol-3-phosphate acyltransferase